MGAPPKAPIFYLSHNPIHHLLNAKSNFMVILLNALSIFHYNLLNAKSIFTHQSIKATISPKRRDMPSACFQCADTLSIASKYTTKKYQRRIFKAVGNGALWLTPCKLACERSLVIGNIKCRASEKVGRGSAH